MRTWKEVQAARYAEVAEAVSKVPPEITENVLTAWRWARDRLIRREGEGHCFHLHRGGYDYQCKINRPDGISCSFAKPEWPADHTGKPMPTGALAIVQATLEYEHGL